MVVTCFTRPNTAAGMTSWGLATTLRLHQFVMSVRGKEDTLAEQSYDQRLVLHNMH